MQSQYIALEHKYLETESKLQKALTRPLLFQKINVPKIKYASDMTDELDIKVGQFMCSYVQSNSLDVPLVRISEGTYLFGTKRLLLSLDDKGRIQAQFNSGHMLLFDYLKYYNEIEYVKLSNSAREKHSKK